MKERKVADVYELPKASISIKKSSADFLQTEITISTSCESIEKSCNALAWLLNLAEQHGEKKSEVHENEKK